MANCERSKVNPYEGHVEISSLSSVSEEESQFLVSRGFTHGKWIEGEVLEVSKYIGGG